MHENKGFMLKFNDTGVGLSIERTEIFSLLDSLPPSEIPDVYDSFKPTGTIIFFLTLSEEI